jgi:hypothetical protein
MTKKEKPIAILTINEDVSKMTLDEVNSLNNWLHKQAFELVFHRKSYGKCRFRLMPQTKGKGK